MKRMTSRQAFRGQPQTSQCAVLSHSVHRILGTCRMEPAGGWQHGRDTQFVGFQAGDDDRAHFSNTLSTSRRKSANGASTAARLRFKTISHGESSRPSDNRTASRTRRLARLRRTALPTARGAVKPTRARSPSPRLRNALKYGPDIRAPSSYVLRKSPDRRILASLGKLTTGLLCVANCSLVADC